LGQAYRVNPWTPFKWRYDAALIACIAAYLATFIYVAKRTWTGTHAISDEVLATRALGTCAIVLLHVILSIGPLARLNPRFLPLLYNRRHMGVMMFFLALAHAAVAIAVYHGFGVVSALESVVTSNVEYRSVSGFPFEILGAIALVILFLMAATSHDIWLRKLSPRVWKNLHMMVYVAWLLLLGHVALGAMQSEHSAAYPILLFAGAIWIGALHLIAGRREVNRDRASHEIERSYWVDVGFIDDFPRGHGRTVCLPEQERVAIFRHSGDRLSALSNVCPHQGGPLGEGRIVDECVTCPWHGFTYRPEDGCAPKPFVEKVATYEVKIVGRRVLVHPAALEPGTRVEPARIDQTLEPEEASA
jgi:nitrite reductase/ring-hydroxylating ferredoxin subunit/DMSO/TMAO reductase YedYZ heme-binding membrane subunit